MRAFYIVKYQNLNKLKQTFWEKEKESARVLINN